MFSAWLLCTLVGFAQADSAVDPNKYFSFKKIYISQAADNVQGTFQPVVEKAYQEVFSKNLRFEIVKDEKDADATLRTEIEKKTTGIDIHLAVLVGSPAEAFAKHDTSVPSKASETDIRDACKQLLKTALLTIPFIGTVTGRDGNHLTFDIGSKHGFKKGDIVRISRVTEIKRHPLTNAIVEVQLIPVGTAVLEKVEDLIAFGQIENELAGVQIQRLHKITTIVDKPLETEKSTRIPGAGMREYSNAFGKGSDLGLLFVTGFIGSVSTQTSQSASSSNFAGSGIAPGVRLGTEIWLTRSLFANILYGTNFTSFTHKGTTGSAETKKTVDVSGTTTNFGINGGYRYYLTDAVSGPSISVELGYHSFKFSPAIDVNTLLGTKTYAGLNLSLGSAIPFSASKISFLFNFNILLFPDISEGGVQTGPTENADYSVSVIGFFLGGQYRFNQRVRLRVGVQFENYNAEFGKTANGVTNQKQIGFLPTLQYLF